VVITRGGKLVDIIDTKTDKQIRLALRSGEYELELKGAPEGLKLSIAQATLTRGKTVLARIRRIPPLDTDVTIKPSHRIPFAGLVSLGVTQDGRYFLASQRGGDEVVRIWKTGTGKLVQEMKWGLVARFTPDGKQVVALSTRPTEHFEVRDIATGKVVRRFGYGAPAWGFWLAPKGTRL